MIVPFHETTPRAGSRRLLLVCYTFPPDGRVGGLRWEMMLHAAAESGWAADVLLIDPADSTDSDESRLTSLPDGLRLYGIPFSKSKLDTLLRLRQSLRRAENPETPTLAVPSASPPPRRGKDAGGFSQSLDRWKRNIGARNHYASWSRWARKAAAAGIELARKTPYECVISSGPPHMAHEAARLIASAISKPLIVDFRDPWTSDDTEPEDMGGETWRSLSNRYESACIAASSMIAVNTESAARFMRAKYPEHASRLITVMNGADPIPPPPELPVKPFTISYTGSLYGGRRPEELLRALRLVTERNKLTRADIRLHFMGVDENQRAPLLELARREGIEQFFTCESRRPRTEATTLIDQSAMLVLLPQVHIHSVPAKVFEYVQRPAWLLVLSEPSTATAELLTGTSADVVSPDDVEGIAAVIAARFQQAQSQGRPAPLNADGRFSRDRQAKIFFTELERVVCGTRELSTRPAATSTPY